jgi:hypothetical protein
MKIKKVEADTSFRAHATAVEAFLAGKSEATFAEVRAALDKTDKELPDGHIHQIAVDAGFWVVG